MELRGKELIKGEPDASSFPSGGIRATFEARGYTVWDITSPAFLYDNGNTQTLCIPTAFCSYTGEALDKKTPLLRSMEAIGKQALRICRLFGDTATQKVIPCVGPEQEYFIVDRQTYLRRKDLIFTGRTLFGAMPPKGQEMEDHYFGAIKERVSNYMKDVDVELWKLGIPAKTEHNEVAPAQHELAPIYNTANVATDENMLVMNVMKKVALRHGLVCLLHEKPFAGVNGSGKHNNWSLVTDTGSNLLNPGKEPQENWQFLLLLAAVMKAVDEHAGLLRVSAANPGNDHRLGANEAPPAVISMFLGEQLTAVVEHIIQGSHESVPSASIMRVGVSTLPFIRRDATDRNRTSPFAFTGNKFEFRMVPSSGCIADANVVLNTIVADALGAFADELEQAEDFDSAMKALVRREMTAHRRHRGVACRGEAPRTAQYAQHGGCHSQPDAAGIHRAVQAAGRLQREGAARPRGGALRALRQDGQHRGADHDRHGRQGYPPGCDPLYDLAGLVGNGRGERGRGCFGAKGAARARERAAQAGQHGAGRAAPVSGKGRYADGHGAGALLSR